MRSKNAEIATRDYNEIRKLKPSIQNAVWHASISFAYDDKVDSQESLDKTTTDGSGSKKTPIIVVFSGT